MTNMDATKGKSRPVVLLVEDDDISRRAMTKLLNELGYDICSASTMTEGLECLDGQAYAILDMDLPDGLGLTILRKARSDKPAMKVAVCSGIVDSALLNTVRQARPDGFFRKPLEFGQLTSWLDSNRAVAG
jgi:CheY-like chemotaxis protein